DVFLNAFVNRNRKYGKTTISAMRMRPSARSGTLPGWFGTSAKISSSARSPKAIAAHMLARSRRCRQNRSVTTPSAMYATMLTYRKTWIAVCKVPLPRTGNRRTVCVFVFAVNRRRPALSPGGIDPRRFPEDQAARRIVLDEAKARQPLEYPRDGRPRLEPREMHADADVRPLSEGHVVPCGLPCH